MSCTNVYKPLVAEQMRLPAQTDAMIAQEL